jgi:hypothetical protein
MPKKLFVYAMPFTLVAMMLVLVGCGGANPTALPLADATAKPTGTPAPTLPPASVAIDACSLLTKADAELILGSPVDNPTQPVQGSETFNVYSCEYYVTGGTPLDNATLIVTVPSNGDLGTALAAFTAGKDQAQTMYNAAPLDVPGLGDAAYWVAGAGNNLTILKGDVYINLSASTQKGDAPSQALLDLAKVVIGRMK